MPAVHRPCTLQQLSRINPIADERRRKIGLICEAGVRPGGSERIAL